MTTTKTYKALLTEEINSDGGRVFFLKLGPETKTEGAPKATPHVEKPAPRVSASNDPFVGQPVPQEYWGRKRRGDMEGATQLIGGFGYFPIKTDDNRWIIGRRDERKGSWKPAPRGGGRGPSSQAAFDSYKYKYNLPYPGTDAFNVNAMRDKLKDGGGRFRSSKFPDGDNCWYSNELIPELEDYRMDVSAAAAEAPKDFSGYKDVHSNDPEKELEATDFDSDDIPF